MCIRDSIGDEFDGVNPGQFEREIARIVTEQGLADRVVLQLSLIHISEPTRPY